MLKRIERLAGGEDIVGALAGLAPTDLQSLLLEVYRRRVDHLTGKDVLNRYEQGRFVAPAPSDPLELIEFDRLALSLIPPGYEPIELSPVAPLGAASVLGSTSQDWAVATSRNTEVVSDSTNVLALECALRRRRDRTVPVKLCASHRLLRGQDARTRGGSQHFRAFTLVAAGRGRAFEVEAVSEQLLFYSRLLGDVRFTLTPLAGTLADEVLDRTTLDATLDPARVSGRGYYVGLCFKIFSSETELGDGGFVEWTQSLLGDRKERLVISGIGSERAIELRARR
jgi:hypothetical protein